MEEVAKLYAGATLNCIFTGVNQFFSLFWHLLFVWRNSEVLLLLSLTCFSGQLVSCCFVVCIKQCQYLLD